MSILAAEQPYVAPYHVAVVQWSKPDGIADALIDALTQLGHQPRPFYHTKPIPPDAEIVFSFAPFGNYMALTERIAAIESSARPVLIHWNTEPIPDLRLPWSLVYPISRLRSWAGRTAYRTHLDDRPLVASLEPRMMRFRCVGDYFDTYRRGILNVFADCSAIYADQHRRHGLPALYLPWGMVPAWHRDLHLQRDIDVLWLGLRATRRRSHLLDKVRGDLRRQGVDIYVVDNVEHAAVYGEDRIELLNRARIVLNLNRGWGDNSLFRFALVAPNGAMMASEPMLPHSPEYKPGVHYISAPVDQLSSTILHYLRNEEERAAIAFNALRLFEQEDMTLLHHVRTLIAQADAIYRRRSQGPIRYGGFDGEVGPSYRTLIHTA